MASLRKDIKVIEGESSIVSVALSSDVAVTSGLDAHIRVYSINDGSIIKDITCDPIETWAISLNEKEKHLLATTGQSGNVDIWNLNEGTKEQSLETERNVFTMSVDFNDNILCCGSMNGSVIVFDTSTQKKLHQLNDHTKCVRSVNISKDRSFFVTSSDDTFTNIYDLETGKLKNTLKGHKSWVLSSAINPNGKYIATSSSDKTIKLWEISTGECLSTLNEHTDSVWRIAWNNSGSNLVSVGSDSKIIISNLFEK